MGRDQGGRHSRHKECWGVGATWRMPEPGRAPSLAHPWLAVAAGPTHTHPSGPCAGRKLPPLSPQ